MSPSRLLRGKNRPAESCKPSVVVSRPTLSGIPHGTDFPDCAHAPRTPIPLRSNRYFSPSRLNATRQAFALQRPYPRPIALPPIGYFRPNGWRRTVRIVEKLCGLRVRHFRLSIANDPR